eukprot:TRINITY_DN8058_c0_g1_i2.p1 TRINITY_DN8058_c0_g1~~TRINITY_DN8058_c0_g1_i2.p1  ORF type:complete len:130 (+),score=15.42 TRINITY_DN8058_c0_g1_i2:3-392(+)
MGHFLSVYFFSRPSMGSRDAEGFSPDAVVGVPAPAPAPSLLFNNQPMPKVKRRIGKIPRKTLALSSFLFIGGCTLLTIASICQFRCKESLGLWVLGSILILPGGYSMYILVSYVRGVRGYHYRLLPETD